MNHFFEERGLQYACKILIFSFYLIKLKKCPCFEASNQYLRIEADLDLLTMHPGMFKVGFHASLIREHSRTLHENRKKPEKSRFFVDFSQLIE